jgi:hypothetical protein
VSLAEALSGRRPKWWDDAACRAPGVAELIADGRVDFFPERGQSTRPAKVVCTDCPVRPECLQWSLDIGTHHGVFGGLSERERRRLRRQRAGAAA